MEQNKFPPGWDEQRVQSAVSDSEQQTEDEDASQNEFSMLMEALTELGPAVCEWVIEVLADNQ